MRQVCDLSYALQVEALERKTLAEMMLAPHVEDASQISSPAIALDEFNRWLVSKPPELERDPAESELLALIGVS